MRVFGQQSWPVRGGTALGAVRDAARSALAGALALVLSGCGDHATAPNSDANIQIVSGLENGWVGSGHEIRALPAVVQRDTWDRHGGPRTTQTTRIDAATWQALIAAIDETALAALPEVIGCPGCADGPTEWLEVRRGAFQKSVRFSPWDDLGAKNAALLQQVRALRADEPTPELVPERVPAR